MEFLTALQIAVVGTKKVCSNPDHCSQFRAVSDILRGVALYYVVWACRSGSKTFLYGGLDSWVKSCSRSRHEIKILGGSKDQSLLSYEAMKLFRDETDPQNSRLVRDLMQSRAEFQNKSKVSILTASRTSVRGPHPQVLKLDEVDEIDNVIYEDALSQPTSKFGWPSSLGMFSTNHHINGQMDRVIKNASEKGHSVYKYCYDDQTEVLTSYGWKLFKDVDSSRDKILSLDPDTRQIEYAGIRRPIRYEYTGDMISFKGAVDLVVTPNHRMFVKDTQRSTTWRLEQADGLVDKDEFYFNQKAYWEPGKVINKRRIGGVAFDATLLAEFMGWFLSEGCVRPNNRIKISQVDPDNRKRILLCVNRLSTYTHVMSIAEYSTSIEFWCPVLHNYLKQFGHTFDKYVPKWIKAADRDVINTFLDAYRLGDGGVGQRRQHFYYTSSERMSADIGELLVKTGYFVGYVKRISSTGNPHWVVYRKVSRTIRKYKKYGIKVEKVPYSGVVYCLELEKNHVMLVRRNGKCSWQGNCIWECIESCRDYRCSTCELSGLCPGTAMKEADGYYKITDFVAKLKTLSYSMLARDWLCIKVGMGDTVYEQEWDEKLHIVSVPLMDKPVVLSVDFGGVDPFSIGVWQEAPAELGGKETWIRVAELYMRSDEESVTNQRVIERAKKAPWWKRVKEIIPDNSRPDLIQEWREALPNATMTVIDKKTVDEGIERVKSALKPVIGIPRILVNRICMHFREEIMMYAVKNGKPIDAYNHSMDETRYFALAKLGNAGGVFVGTPKRDVMP